MKSLVHIFGLAVLFVLSLSCSDVKFRSDKNTGGGDPTQTCVGSACPAGTYSWFQGGFGMCTKACGGGTRTQTVECRRNSDNVGVADSFCTDAKPAASETCNAQACAGTYNWNAGPFGNCTQTCGGGQRTRTVICQDQSGTTVAEGMCTAAKPATSESCNTNVCPPVTYDWEVTTGVCSKQCGGGTATDVVVCKRNDGVTVPEVNCTSPKPPTTRTCNMQACPVVYTYSWEPGAYTTCSKPCGTGIQTRSVVCKRSDGAYVPENYCDAGTKPVTQQNCNTQACPTGRKVTQTGTVTPALNSVDVILIVDDSSSMKNDQAKLAARMSGLLSDLDALNIDYQVCLTTTDISYYKGSPIKWKGPESYVMTKSTPNKNQVFLNTIDALGAEWSSDEQGIKAQSLMIKDFRSSGCLRTAATLSTILISDENERSVGGNKSWSTAQYQPLTAENMPDNLIAQVKNVFGSTKKFIWNSIIVKPGDTACEAKQDKEASPSFFGTMYAELSNKTGGHVGSICDTDYAQNLKYIKEKTVNSMPGLTMECTPTDTPVVTFDRPVSTSVTVTGNVIKFSPALSEGVKYTAVYTCPN